MLQIHCCSDAHSENMLGSTLVILGFPYCPGQNHLSEAFSLKEPTRTVSQTVFQFLKHMHPSPPPLAPHKYLKQAELRLLLNPAPIDHRWPSSCSLHKWSNRDGNGILASQVKYHDYYHYQHSLIYWIAIVVAGLHLSVETDRCLNRPTGYAS